ncbi:cupin domain-containing protein [Oceanibaculum pacificum]|uniref:Cupin type-2 domain-containing protein n=1 Tax=Oceanibaculum pacificum TaxID=580166 RepID=A0A154W8H5_9PROT|nr:cupin domain-containing protein [Oceanibaculum pacificum]KZD09811.1 hypothetical protein AUP43_01125 [Oceanibaculum pacificum]
MEKVNLADKLSRFAEPWSPRLVGQVNDAAIKLVKLRGEFVWHHHETEDEMFFVIEGRLRMRFRDRDVDLEPGEFIIVPRQVEHLPIALTEEVSVMLIEPDTTLNTGNIRNERTVEVLQKL